MNLKYITILPFYDAVFKVFFIVNKTMVIIIYLISTIPKAIIKINKMICFLTILNRVNSIKLDFNYFEFPNNSITINHD